MVVKKQRTVVTGPSTPSAPTIGSRTNSTQALPKSSHKPTTTQPTTTTTTTKSNLSKSIILNKKNQKHKKHRKNSPISHFFDYLLILLLSTFTFYTYTRCSSPESPLQNPLCRSLYIYKTHVVDPYILPGLSYTYETVTSHPTVNQLQLQLQPYVERVKPHTERAVRLTSHYSKQAYGRVILPTWNNRVLPLSKSAWGAGKRGYHRSLHPHIQPHLAKLEPYTSQITAYSEKAYTQLHPRLLHFAEHTHTFWVHARHYGSILFNYVNRVYVILRPYLITAAEKLQTGVGLVYGKTKPLVVQGWETYVGPHLNTISEKVVELSGKPKVNGNGKTATSSYTYRVKEDEEVEEGTKASAEEATASVTLSTATAGSKVSTTAEEAIHAPAETAAAPEVPEEPSVPAASFTPSSPSSVETQTEELASASSVIADRAPPESVKASLVEEINSSSSSIAAVTASSAEASITPTSTSAKEAVPTTEIEQLASAASVIASRNPEDTSVVEEIKASATSVASAILEEEDVDGFLADLGIQDDQHDASKKDDDDLDSFLTDLGLDESGTAQESQKNSEQSEQHQPQEQTDQHQRQQETPEEREIRLSIQRAEIENRHLVWEDKLIGLVQDSERDLIEFLSAFRGVAARLVGGKTPDKDLLSTLDMRVDLTNLNQIDGIPITGLISSLEKEGEKLLSGIEGWVKREKATPPSEDEKTRKAKSNKLDQLVKKVKERFDEKVNEMQGRVHRWYVGVRDVESQECLQVVRQIKNLADEAQADLGMDYAWLENVNYHDWQRYHDLTRVYEYFDKLVRHMQNPEQNTMPELGEIPKAFTDKLHLVALGADVNYPVQGDAGDVAHGTQEGENLSKKVDEKAAETGAEAKQDGKDEIVLALDALAQELDLLVLGWEWRAKEVEERGRTAILGEEKKKVESANEKVEQIEGSEEPVKILPIEPAPGKEEIGGAPQVPIIGKSKEQIEQALNAAGFGARDEL